MTYLKLFLLSTSIMFSMLNGSTDETGILGAHDESNDTHLEATQSSSQGNLPQTPRVKTTPGEAGVKGGLWLLGTAWGVATLANQCKRGLNTPEDFASATTVTYLTWIAIQNVLKNGYHYITGNKIKKHSTLNRSLNVANGLLGAGATAFIATRYFRGGQTEAGTVTAICGAAPAAYGLQQVMNWNKKKVDKKSNTEAVPSQE